MTSRTDVVIIGAGFTGLSAATTLRERGISTIVLEARDRVGGRVASEINALGERVDTGGQFLCEDMPQIMALARARGKTLVEMNFDGEVVSIPRLEGAEAERCYAGSMALRDRVNAVEPDDPAIAGVSLANWLFRQPEPDDAKAAFRAMIEGLWCVALEALPVWYLASNDRRITNEKHELQFSLAETMHSLAGDMGADLGDALRLGMAASMIERGDDGVRVTMKPFGETIEARATIIAVPPVAASRIAHAPALPRPLESALGMWRSGSVVKVVARYAEPFWRAKGRSGMVVWRDPSGLFAFDASPELDTPMLAFFVGGPLARRWHDRNAAALETDVKERLAAALGPEAAEPLDLTIRDWTDDRWSGGAYSDVAIMNSTPEDEETLCKGAPPVWFASSELSPSFPGYIEGALVAGRNAADAVVSSLERQSFSATSASGS